jgi:hypothetical protein
VLRGLISSRSALQSKFWYRPLVVVAVIPHRSFMCALVSAKTTIEIMDYDIRRVIDPAFRECNINS